VKIPFPFIQSCRLSQLWQQLHLKGSNKVIMQRICGCCFGRFLMSSNSYWLELHNNTCVVLLANFRWCINKNQIENRTNPNLVMIRTTELRRLKQGDNAKDMWVLFGSFFYVLQLLPIIVTQQHLYWITSKSWWCINKNQIENRTNPNLMMVGRSEMFVHSWTEYVGPSNCVHY
jgi:hypothetical protein